MSHPAGLTKRTTEVLACIPTSPQVAFMADIADDVLGSHGQKRKSIIRHELARLSALGWVVLEMRHADCDLDEQQLCASVRPCAYKTVKAIVDSWNAPNANKTNES